MDSPLRTAICLASDHNYIDYTYVTALSIKEHASEKNCYEVVILNSGVLEYKKQLFYALNSDNFSVRFVDMEEHIEQTGMKEFFLSRHISTATYFRYFIPEIFSDYDRVLYMDGDVIALEDVAGLFSFDMDGRMLGVVVETDAPLFPDFRKVYHTDKLFIDSDQYFCAGILLYNIPICLAEKLQEKCFETQARLVDPPLHDQDVLNCVTFGRNIILPTRWHLMLWIWSPTNLDNLRKHSPENHADYSAATNDPALLHFGGPIKPWKNPSLPFADLWWKYARKAPFYERFLSEMHQFQINVSANGQKKHYTTLINAQGTILREQTETLNALREENHQLTTQLEALRSTLSGIEQQLQRETGNHERLEALHEENRSLWEQLGALRQKEEQMHGELIHATILSSRRYSLKIRYAACCLFSRVTFGDYQKKLMRKGRKLKAQLDFLKLKEW
ncbi:MAG: hypothetical protein IKJ34_08485 [Mailhella sp.]|nr:hypothetical protein [Mailhella sp.]